MDTLEVKIEADALKKMYTLKEFHQTYQLLEIGKMLSIHRIHQLNGIPCDTKVRSSDESFIINRVYHHLSGKEAD